MFGETFSSFPAQPLNPFSQNLADRIVKCFNLRIFEAAS